uniref:Uncharacterized protein n=1 Tax=Kalanchoe fedtschenkoi TaxID=63787 RepID=A0A7N0VMI7_KALFE
MLLDSTATPTKNCEPLSNAFTSTYQVFIADVCHNVTFAWVKSWTTHSLTMTVQSTRNEDEYECEILLQSYLFKCNKGRKTFQVGCQDVSLFWDLRSAKHSNGPQPCSSYYIALASNGEILLLLGDLNHKAVNDTRSIPSSNEALLICTAQNVHGKSEFSAKMRLAEEHSISIKSSLLEPAQPQMWISIDGAPIIRVLNLNWRFRGNQTVSLNNMKLNIMWDVYDWLFNAHGLGQGLFIFKPSSGVDPPNPHWVDRTLTENRHSALDSCHFLYAWKTD